jgi:hypothetical protein
MSNDSTMNTETEIETTGTAMDVENGVAMDAEDTATEEQLEADSEEEAKAPAWIDFCAALNAHAQALGLSVQTQRGFTKYLNLETGHKLYVAKQGKEVKRVDTTLPILGQDGTYPLSKENGKIECHVIADLATVTAVLTQLADGSVGKIRSAKRAPKAEVEATIEEAPAAE